MSREITVNVSLAVRKLDSNGRPLIDERMTRSFTSDIDGTAKGPVPGAVTIATTGTDIDLSELTEPGVAWFENQDDTNYVEWGIFDPQTNVFYYVGEIRPGEAWPIRLSRNIREEYAGPGTGTTAPTNTLRFYANTAACIVNIKAFEK